MINKCCGRVHGRCVQPAIVTQDSRLGVACEHSWKPSRRGAAAGGWRDLAKLVVIDGPDRAKEFALTGRIIFNIGSDPQASVALSDGQVAGSHCRLYKEGDCFTLFDVSGQGLLVNGKRVVKAVLADGDVIRVGSSDLCFTSAGLLRAASGQGADAVSSSSSMPASRRAPEITKAWMQCVEGNDKGKVFDISEGEVWVIGRGYSADLTVLDIKVSRLHCRIVRAANQYTLSDLNSTNGTFVNGQQVDQQVLARGDYVKVGYTILSFQYQSLDDPGSGGTGGGGDGEVAATPASSPDSPARLKGPTASIPAYEGGAANVAPPEPVETPPAPGSGSEDFDLDFSALDD